MAFLASVMREHLNDRCNLVANHIGMLASMALIIAWVPKQVSGRLSNLKLLLLLLLLFLLNCCLQFTSSLYLFLFQRMM